MPKKVSICLNISPLIVFIAFFRFGGTVTLHMLIPLLVISILNVVFSKSMKSLLGFNVILLVSSVAGVAMNGLLYFNFIYYDDIGEAIMCLEAIAVAVLIVFLTVVELLIKYFCDKKKIE